MNPVRVPFYLDNLPKWQSTARRLAPLAKTAITITTTTSSRQTRHFHRPSRALPIRSTPAVLPITPHRALHHKSRYSTAPAIPFNPEPTIHPVFEPSTCTYQYVVADSATNTAVIIDPVLDYNPCTRTIATSTADALLALVHAHHYRVSHILETHAHADHLTAAFYLQRRLAQRQGAADGEPPKVGIGKRIGGVQKYFGGKYGVGEGEYAGVFNVLWEDDEAFEVGGLKGRVVHLPGHTEDHVGYWIGDNVFCGDLLFHPSLGTARCDFPGGNPRALYHSARMLLSLPDHVRIWTGHDYPAEGERGPEPWASVGEHREKNKHVRDGITEEEFVATRSGRDKTLAAPRLVHESLQVNIRAGHLPQADEAGMRVLMVPVSVQGEW
ncbi:Putative metallo-beta-lactamase domain protein [Madurella fahalii]|uniref:Metallo-beta-lactamase domain protein n=1 Tax=Madurella fahalii TaxID=1157608 RepID=A0ABQ0GGY8_9PEZI